VGIWSRVSEYTGQESWHGWWLRHWHWHWNGKGVEGGDMVAHVRIRSVGGG